MKLLYWFLQCHHQWRKAGMVEEVDVKSGGTFWADVYICRRCEARQTVEHLRQPTIR